MQWMKLPGAAYLKNTYLNYFSVLPFTQLFVSPVTLQLTRVEEPSCYLPRRPHHLVNAVDNFQLPPIVSNSVLQ